jgi:acetyl esterase/lipase
VRPAGDIRPPLPAGVKRASNIEYSKPASGALLLDLYLPVKASAQPLPVVLWMHGGGWKAGSKENCPLTWLAGEGYAVASLGYRLSWLAKWPAQLDDARAAIRWLRTNAQQHHLDPTRIAVGGGSSGGNLAGVVGTAPPAADETIPSRVNAVIDFYGTADLLTLPPNLPRPGRSDADLAQTNGARLLGAIPRDHPALARQVSILHHVSKDDPPFLIFHGDLDDQVPVKQSERLHARLKEFGVPSELHVLPGAGHGGKAFDAPPVRAAIRAFLARVMPAPAS